jgi:hypothetical protein
MVDYRAWVKVDPLTVEQAARLWTGLDPTAVLYSNDSARLEPRRQMLLGAIKRGILPRNEQSEVTRSDLKAFATSIGEWPEFLFYSDPLPTISGPKKVSKAPPPLTTLRGDWVHMPRVDGQSAAETPTSAREQPESLGPTDAVLAEWYIKRVNEWPLGKPPPDRDDDTDAAHDAFGCTGLRERVRALRSKHAKHWTRSGPNGRKRGQAR